jgi:multiple sugar transport system substrate-binding protein
MARRSIRRVAAALAVATATATVTACGGDSSDSGKIQLEFWNPETDAGALSVLEKMVAGFEKDNPDVDINLVTIPWSDIYTKWQTALQSGDAPDATIGSASFAASFQAQGVLEPLDDVVDQIGGESAWAQTASSLVQLSKQDDSYYTLPFVNNCVVLWYNKSMLAAAGLQPPKTWDELEAAAKAMTHDDQYGLLIPSSTSQVTTQSLYSVLRSNGGELVDLDDPDTVTFDDAKSVEALDFYTSLAQYSPPGSGGYDRPEAQAAMTTGKLGMFIYGSWMQSALEEAGPEVASNFGVVPVPANNGAGGSFMGNLTLMAFKGSEHPAETKKFLSYMYDPALYEEFVLQNPASYTPVTEAVQQSQTYLDNDKVKSESELLAAVREGLPNAWVFGLPNTHAGEWEGVNLIAEAVTAVIEQGESPESAAKAVAEEMRSSIGG